MAAIVVAVTAILGGIATLVTKLAETYSTVTAVTTPQPNEKPLPLVGPVSIGRDLNGNICTSGANCTFQSQSVVQKNQSWPLRKEPAPFSQQSTSPNEPEPSAKSNFNSAEIGNDVQTGVQGNRPLGSSGQVSTSFRSISYVLARAEPKRFNVVVYFDQVQRLDQMPPRYSYALQIWHALVNGHWTPIEATPILTRLNVGHVLGIHLLLHSDTQPAELETIRSTLNKANLPVASGYLLAPDFVPDDDAIGIGVGASPVSQH